MTELALVVLALVTAYQGYRIHQLRELVECRHPAPWPRGRGGHRA